MKALYSIAIVVTFNQEKTLVEAISMIVNCETFADGSFAAVPLMQSSWSVLAEILLSRVCMLEAEFPRWKSVRVWAPSLAE